MGLADTKVYDSDLFKAAEIYFNGDIDEARIFCSRNFFDLCSKHVIHYHSRDLGLENSIHFKDLEKMVASVCPEHEIFLSVVRKMYDEKKLYELEEN